MVQQQAGGVCFTPCAVTTTQMPFSLSVPVTASILNADGTITAGVSTTGVSQILPSNCNNDYLIIAGGYDPTVVVGVFGNVLDRFCGERFTTTIGSPLSSTVCSKSCTVLIIYYIIIFKNILLYSFVLFHI